MSTDHENHQNDSEKQLNSEESKPGTLNGLSTDLEDISSRCRVLDWNEISSNDRPPKRSMKASARALYRGHIKSCSISINNFVKTTRPLARVCRERLLSVHPSPELSLSEKSEMFDTTRAFIDLRS